jgi:hypothetical protein
VKEDKMGWGERNAYRSLVGNPDGKRTTREM